MHKEFADHLLNERIRALTHQYGKAFVLKALYQTLGNTTKTQDKIRELYQLGIW